MTKVSRIAKSWNKTKTPKGGDFVQGAIIFKKAKKKKGYIHFDEKSKGRDRGLSTYI